MNKIEATYDYVDEKGKLLYQSVRFNPKDFAQRRPDKKRPGKWINSIKGIRRVLYRLLDILSASLDRIVFIVEGEKDADRLASLGEIATTNAMGVGKWHKEYSETLRGRRIVILPDNDDKGRGHAIKVATSLHGIAAGVKIVQLPDLPLKGDVSDWLDKGHTKKELLELVATAEIWQPEESDIRDGKQDDKKQAENHKESQTTQIASIAAEDDFFHSPDKAGYVTVEVVNAEGLTHKENLKVSSKQYRSNLMYRYYRQHEKAPSGNAMNDAIAIIEGKALFSAPEHPVFIRIAEHEGKIYVDLGNEGWEAVEVSSEGWRVISEPPVKFHRAPGMLPLPTPLEGGNILQLQKFVNVPLTNDFLLLVSWILGSLNPNGPFPILNIHGEHGSAKSTLTKVLRSLIDPNLATLRSEPKDERDLMIAARNGWLMTFDNISRLRGILSDALCRLSTGGSLATRQLYSDDEEKLFNSKRPILLNGISELATRPDLLDRSLILYLPRLSQESRRSEKELLNEFEKERPYILGSIFTALASILKNHPPEGMPYLPRMADYMLWVTAAEPSLELKHGTFAMVHQENYAELNYQALESSPLIVTLLQMIEKEPAWSGTATDLLDKLNTYKDPNIRAMYWPLTPAHLGRQLRRYVPNLEAIGITLEFRREGSSSASHRLIEIKNWGEGSVSTVASVNQDSNDSNIGNKAPCEHRQWEPHPTEQGIYICAICEQVWPYQP